MRQQCDVRLKKVHKMRFLRGGPVQGQGPLCSLGAGSYILLWAPYITNTFSYQHKQFMFFAENLENENKSKGKCKLSIISLPRRAVVVLFL